MGISEKSQICLYLKIEGVYEYTRKKLFNYIFLCSKNLKFCTNNIECQSSSMEGVICFR